MNAVLDLPLSTFKLAENARIRARPVPAIYDTHRAFWLDKTPQLADIAMPVPDRCIDEMDRMLKLLPRLADGQQPSATMIDAATRASLDALLELAARVRHQLEEGAGAVLVDRFPAERWSDADNRRVSGLFAELLAPLKPQGHDGTLLYDVMDLQVTDVSKVRRSITNLGQPYHTDGPWVAAPARFIGLYCLRNAGAGGHSRVTSLLCALEALREIDGGVHRNELMIMQPWDRQGEHADNESLVEEHPVFVESETGIVSRFYESYVRKGYTLAGRTMPASTDAALRALGEQLEVQPSVSFLMQPGQYQFANNYSVVHARDAFEDDNPGLSGRRLVRVWNA